MLARLNGPLTEDDDMAFVNKMISWLKYVLIQTPEWWTKSDSGQDLYDVNVILEIYKQCMDFENKWLDKVWTVESTSESAKEPTQVAI